MERIIKFDGFLLSNKSNGENGSLALVLTEDKLIYIIANNGNRISKKNFPLSSRIGSLLSFECINIDNELLRLKSYSTISFFGDFASNLKTSSFLLLINELSQKLLLNSKTNMFKTYEKSMEYLKLGVEPINILLFFLRQLLIDLGIAPNTNSCVNCAKTKNLVFFSFSQGGYLCSSCYTGQNKMNRQELLTYRYLFSFNFDCKESQNIKKETVEKIIKDIILYLQDYFSIQILNFDLFIKVN